MRRLIIGLFVIVFAWTAGLLGFIAALPEPETDGAPQGAGVVVYTGGGGARIAAAMSLLSNGAGQRLLISGVHPETSRARLSEMWKGPQSQFDCCVDLDRNALSTEGNAAELSVWARAHKFDTIILVTSEYHMPRAIAETREKMPDATLTPYPVSSGYLNEKGRPTSLEAWEKLAGEYIKFLLTRIKTFF